MHIHKTLQINIREGNGSKVQCVKWVTILDGSLLYRLQHSMSIFYS